MTTPEQLIYRLMIDGEEDIVSRLVHRSFKKHVAVYYKREGIDVVLRLSEANSIRTRKVAGNIFIVCDIGCILVGMMEIRPSAHIGLLFVDPDHANRGIGSGFIVTAKEYAAENSDTLTVNASPNSVTFYEKCGFTHAGGEKEEGGILFYPMVLVL